MSEERSGVERVLRAIDGFRGLFGFLIVAVIAVAAIRAGGTAGWALGATLLALCATGVVLLVAVVRRG